MTARPAGQGLRAAFEVTPSASDESSALPLRPTSVCTGTFLGEASVDLLQVCDGQPHQLQLQLEGGPCAEEGLEEGSNRAGSSGGQESGHGNSGSVRLGCHFVPFAELLADGAAPEVDGRPLLATPGEVRAVARCRQHQHQLGVSNGGGGIGALAHNGPASTYMSVGPPQPGRPAF